MSIAARTRHNVLGVLVDALDYDAAVGRIVDAALERRPFAATALAVHGVMTAVRDPAYRFRLNRLDLVTPDGQPVRWAMNALYRAGLTDRVYGPTLMARVLARAETERLPVFLYGSRPELLRLLTERLAARYADLVVAGVEPSRFRPAGPGELDGLTERIASSGARILFVGLGCPRQEVFVDSVRDGLALPALAVGAAFDYLAGTRREPPAAVQRAGLQWAWRLAAEPRRLWRRYLLSNPSYSVLVALQALRLWRPDPAGVPPSPDAAPDL